MKHRFFLTSLIVAGLIRPAMAETFPADGYMQEDKIYENAATYTNTGVYDGSVTATAEYTDNVYNIAAGTYLPAGAEVAETCTAGNFCAGKANATYDETAPQGITACPTGYPNSAAGAGAENQCYTACTLATANIAHATGVSGNDYFGDGADTCAATDCDPGYHVNSEVKLVEKEPLIPVDYTKPVDGIAYLNGNGTGIPDGVLENDESFGAGLTEPNTWAVHYDNAIVYGHSSCQERSSAEEAQNYYNDNIESLLEGTLSQNEFESGLAEILGTTIAKYVTNRLLFIMNAFENGTMSEEEAGDEMSDLFDVVLATDFDANYSTTDTGPACYCQATGYTPIGGSFESVTLTPWISSGNTGSADFCAISCTASCIAVFGHNVGGSEYFINAVLSMMLGARGFESGGTCDANDIKINWSDAEEIGDAGMCKYGGDIKTPVKAVTKTGKTFKGWRFEKAN